MQIMEIKRAAIKICWLCLPDVTSTFAASLSSIQFTSVVQGKHMKRFIREIQQAAIKSTDLRTPLLTN